MIISSTESGPDPLVASDKASVETIRSVRWWSDTLFSFRTTRAPRFDFTPGQFARLGLHDGGELLWRAYSIVSAPDDTELEYFAVLVPQGSFSPLLARMRPGEAILTERASHGFMTATRFTAPARDLWLLATGTGLGPFLSVLQDRQVWQKYRNLILVQGARHVHDLAYQDLLARLQRQPTAPSGATLRLIQSITAQEQPAAPNRLHGRITDLLRDGRLEAGAGLAIGAEDSHILLCGNPEMIAETRQILHERGLRPNRRAAPGHFLSENYW